MAGANPLPGQAGVVLDTNVALDLFMFGDARVAGLAGAMAREEVVLLTDADCTEEFRRVLGYPVFALDESARAALMSKYQDISRDAVARCGEALSLRCSDRDDQKFLELAWRTGAALLTRDKALLMLQRRFGALGGGRICKPEAMFPAMP